MQEPQVGRFHSPALQENWLVGDVGGTNARLGWVAGPGAPVIDIRVYRVAEHASLEEVIRHYLSDASAAMAGATPARAAVAVATALDGDEVLLTNAHWRFSISAMRTNLGLSSFQVLNDFEALALSLPRLGAQQLRPHGALPLARGTLGVIGPGTGLGVGGVIQTPSGWIALSSEGGHATLAPTDDFESEVLHFARRELPHVSAERLLSGIGLPLLHRSVAGAMGRQVDSLSTEVIVQQGLAGDEVCSRTIDSFCAFLGSFAGGVALTLGSRGGMFIGGGIVPRLGERFFTSQFRPRFEAKGRFQPYLAAIPTALITDTLAALSGAALAIEQALPSR